MMFPVTQKLLWVENYPQQLTLMHRMSPKHPLKHVSRPLQAPLPIMPPVRCKSRRHPLDLLQMSMLLALRQQLKSNNIDQGNVKVNGRDARRKLTRSSQHILTTGEEIVCEQFGMLRGRSRDKGDSRSRGIALKVRCSLGPGPLRQLL